MGLTAALLNGCQTGRIYPDPAGPRYTGGGTAMAVPPSSGSPDTVLVGTFNVKFAVAVDSAVAVLRGDPHLSRADIILLQEMDEAATRRIASALGMAWVYYPAIRRTSTGRDFGNAVLSRWPIVDDRKLILPHRAIFGWTQRIATRATVRVGATDVHVYSVHLATPVNLALRDRRDQMRAVLRDASSRLHVIIGGDLNSHDLGEMAARRGYAWPTDHGPRTVTFGRWDHIFFKGLVPPARGAAGTVEDNREASDHKPVWAKGVLR